PRPLPRAPRRHHARALPELSSTPGDETPPTNRRPPSTPDTRRQPAGPRTLARSNARHGIGASARYRPHEVRAENAEPDAACMGVRTGRPRSRSPRPRCGPETRDQVSTLEDTPPAGKSEAAGEEGGGPARPARGPA